MNAGARFGFMAHRCCVWLTEVRAVALEEEKPMRNRIGAFGTKVTATKITSIGKICLLSAQFLHVMMIRGLTKGGCYGRKRPVKCAKTQK
jgi:hypothetical protein